MFPLGILFGPSVQHPCLESMMVINLVMQIQVLAIAAALAKPSWVKKWYIWPQPH